MSNTFEPWQRHSSLTAERLSTIASALREARDEALNTYEPLKGETVWSLGCSQYDRSKFCIRELARLNSAWMAIVPEKSALRCTFAVEGVPIRFYHQTADEPPEKYTSSTEGEDRQYQMLFEVDGETFVQTLFRLAIKNYSTGKVESITLVEFDSAGAIINEYSIPFGVVSSSIIPLRTKPVNLEPPAIEPLEHERREDDEITDANTGTK